MDESGWLQCTDLQAMLTFLGPTLDVRRTRLFACASCRLIWSLLTEDAWKRAVEVSERFANGKVSSRELARAWRLCWTAESPNSARSAALDTTSTSPSAGSVAYHIQRAAWWSALRQVGNGAPPWSPEERMVGLEARRNIERQQCDLLREICCFPGKCPPIDPSWRVANHSAVSQLTTLIDRDHDYSHLPVLADALEEAGCQDAHLLDHLRRPTGHVPGCWAVDAVLGR